MSSREGTKFYKRADFKLTLWYVFTFAVTTLIVFSFMYVRLEHHLLKEIDGFLEDEVRDFRSDILKYKMDVNAAMRDYEEEDISIRKFHPLGARVLNEEGKVIAASRNFAKSVYPLYPEKLRGTGGDTRHSETVKVPGHRTPFRVISFRLSIDGKTAYIVQIATRMRRMRRILGNFRENLLTAIPIVLFLGATGVGFSREGAFPR